MTDMQYSPEYFLKEKGEYTATTVGVSMYPLLRDRKYAVKIIPVNGRLEKYDVALFRRGEQLVLHRVVKVFPDRYYIRGDNCNKGEYVTDSQIIGKLYEIRGEKKRVRMTDRSYILYARLTVFFHPLRRFFKFIYRGVRRVVRFFGKTK